MKSINLIYKNGHFYDAESKQRLELADGAEVMLVVTDPEFVKPQEFVGETPNPKTVEALNNKLKRLKENREVQQYELLYPRGTHLYFTIPIAIDNKTYTQYDFQVELLEELYAIIKTSWKDQSAGLYDCTCVVIDNPSQNIDFFEIVCAKSLNELYKNTYVHYFRNKGNPACNAMDRFYLNENPNETIRKKIVIK
jgi:hypothetical protein